jgi:hypothetical protein
MRGISSCLLVVATTTAASAKHTPRGVNYLVDRANGNVVPICRGKTDIPQQTAIVTLQHSISTVICQSCPPRPVLGVKTGRHNNDGGLPEWRWTSKK